MTTQGARPPRLLPRPRGAHRLWRRHNTHRASGDLRKKAIAIVEAAK
jgi:hypothetical protein